MVFYFILINFHFCVVFDGKTSFRGLRCSRGGCSWCETFVDIDNECIMVSVLCSSLVFIAFSFICCQYIFGLFL